MEKAHCPWLHLDVMDNHFVPNLTFGPPVVKALRPISRNLFFDTHLMVESPLSMAEEFAAAGAQLLTIHQEVFRTDGELSQAIKAIKSLRLRAGVSLKPKTPVSAIESVLAAVDLVLVMTVEPGFGGQALIPSCLGKVRNLKKLRESRGLRFRIEVDGGINQKTAELAVAAGADILVAGSAVFKDSRVADNVRVLRDSLGNGVDFANGLLHRR